MVRVVRPVYFVAVMTLLAASQLFAQGPEAPYAGVGPDTIALTNVTLIDGTGAPPRSSITVVLEGETIGEIFHTGEQPVPSSAEVIDLTGRFLIPGLINTHLHLPMLGRSRNSVADYLERMLFAGVTSIRDPAGDARLAAELDRARLIDDAPFPSIYWAARMAGPSFFKGAAGHPSWVGYAAGEAPWAQSVASDSDLERAVALAVGAGATGLKLYADLGPDVVRGLVAEAHRQGMMAWAHATIFPTRPLETVRAGVNSLSHACLLLFELQQEIPASRSDAKPLNSDSLDLDNGRFSELLNEMSIRGGVVDATARKQSRIWETRHAGCTPAILDATLRAIHGAGVPISTGTDFFLSNGEPDPTLFSEIEYLVESNVLTPLEAISAATLHGATAIGIDQRTGSIETGKMADLVILADDPSENIDAIQNVYGVVKKGLIRYRKTYDEEHKTDKP